MASNDMIRVNNELKRMWRKGVVAKKFVQSWQFPGWNNATKNSCHDNYSWCSGWNSKQTSPEYKSEVFMLQSTCSVTRKYIKVQLFTGYQAGQWAKQVWPLIYAPDTRINSIWNATAGWGSIRWCCRYLHSTINTSAIKLLRVTKLSAFRLTVCRGMLRLTPYCYRVLKCPLQVH
jgi:hypothetical protein